MKSTGVVRKIDSLGRIVIPKEIRRTHHVREGDPLEIFTDINNTIILKKYSPIGEMLDFAIKYAEVLFKVTKLPTLICNRDAIIAVEGCSKKEFLDKKISPELESLMESRENFVKTSSNTKILPTESSDKPASIISTIISNTDVIGAIVMLSSKTDAKETEVNTKLCQIAATLLGKQADI